MATYIINLKDQTVTTGGNTCNFIEAGLYDNDGTQTPYTDEEEITEVLEESDPKAKVIFE